MTEAHQNCLKPWTWRTPPGMQFGMAEEWGSCLGEPQEAAGGAVGMFSLFHKLIEQVYRNLFFL